MTQWRPDPPKKPKRTRSELGRVDSSLLKGGIHMTSREYAILTTYAGGATQVETGRAFGLSNERVRQIVAKTIRIHRVRGKIVWKAGMEDDDRQFLRDYVL